MGVAPLLLLPDKATVTDKMVADVVEALLGTIYLEVSYTYYGCVLIVAVLTMAVLTMAVLTMAVLTVTVLTVTVLIRVWFYLLWRYLP